MEYKLKIGDVVKVVIFVSSLLGMWYSTKYQVDALTEKVSKLEKQLEETNLGVIKNDIEYIKEGQKELKDDLRDYYNVVNELVTSDHN